VTDAFDKQVSEAAFDVAIERMKTLYPSQQSFVFGEKGDPFWAHFQPTQEEVELLTRALSVLEGVALTPAPLTVRGASGQFTAMVLDAERTLFLVLLAKSSPRPLAEARARRVPDSLSTWRVPT
jgi:hypothetical protein